MAILLRYLQRSWNFLLSVSHIRVFIQYMGKYKKTWKIWKIGENMETMGTIDKM